MKMEINGKMLNVELLQDSLGGIDLVASSEDTLDLKFYVAGIDSLGELHRYKNISASTGLRLNSDGQIIEFDGD